MTPSSARTFCEKLWPPIRFRGAHAPPHVAVGAPPTALFPGYDIFLTALKKYFLTAERHTAHAMPQRAQSGQGKSQTLRRLRLGLCTGRQSQNMMIPRTALMGDPFMYQFARGFVVRILR